MASPISDQPFNIKKHENIEQVVPIKIEMSSARCMKSYARGSVINVMMLSMFCLHFLSCVAAGF